MLHLFYSIILFLFFSTPTYAATGLYDEGVLKGYLNAINCVGSDITCTFSGITGTFTLAGSGTVTGWTKTGTVIAQTVSTDTVSITGSTTISTGASVPLTLDTTGTTNLDFKLNGTTTMYDGSIIGIGGRFFPSGTLNFWSEATLEDYLAFNGATNVIQVVGAGFQVTATNTYFDTCPNATYLYTGSAGVLTCGTATLVTTSDVGTVTGTMIANDSVALTTDTSGNYVATITATKETGLATSGSCSSEGCASTLGFDYTQTATNNPTMAARNWIPGQNTIIFEGTTADTNEGQFLVSDFSGGDKTWTLPNSSGTVILSGHTFTSDVTATLGTGGTTALTIAADSVALGTDTSGQLPLSEGGTAANLTDPNADRVYFWDDSAGATDWLTLGNGFTISGTTVVATKFDPASFTQFFDDFTGNSATVGEYAWTSQASGTGATATNVSGEANHPGIREAQTGTTTTGYAGWNNKVAGMACNGGDVIEMMVRFSANTGIVWRGGLQDTFTSADNVDGYYFEFDPATSANWRYATSNNSSRTKTSSSTAVAANTWYKLKIVVNSANTSVEYFVDGTSIGTIATNIPTSARTIGVTGIIANDGVSTTSVNWDWDYVYFYNDTLSR